MKKTLIAALILTALGIILFAISSGNEIMTFIGFACFLPGTIALAMVALKKLLKKKFLWIPATAIAGLIIFVVSTLLFVVFFFPNETVRKIVQEQAALALRRPVSIGYLKVSLLEGITVANVSVYDKAGSKKKLLSAKSLILSYKLLPVLTGQLIIYKAVLKEPTINVRRFKIGNKTVSNIDDLLSPPGKTMAMLSPPPAQKSALPSIPMAIHISEIGLKGGSISIADSASKGFKNVYKLDKLDMIISDFNWPAVKPLNILFNFRMSMQEITASGAKGRQSFSITPGFKGKITLLPDGKSFKPDGKIQFYSKNGLFYGQKILEAGNQFLTDLKRDFFKAIKDEVKKRINKFESGLKKKMSGFTSGAMKKIAALKRATISEKGTILGQLGSKKSKSEKGFAAKAASTLTDTEKDINSLSASVRKSYNEVKRKYPGVAHKLKLQKYLNQANQVTTAMRNSVRSRINKNKKTLSTQLTAIVTQAERAYTSYIAGIETKFNRYITQYGAKLKNEFLKRVDKLEKYADKYKLNIPFLQKRLTFTKAESFLSFKNGRLSFKNLKIGSQNFSVKAMGYYGFIDSSMALKVDFKADKKYNKNAFLSLFAGPDGDLYLPVEVSKNAKGFKLKLMGKTIIGRMKKTKGKKANNFINDYIAKVNIKNISAAFRKSGKAPKGKGYLNDMDRSDSSSNKGLSSIRSEYKRRVEAEKRKFKEAIKKEAKKLLKKKSGGLLNKVKKKKFW